MNLKKIVDKTFDEGQLFNAADICEATGAIDRPYELRQEAIAYREKKDPEGAGKLREKLQNYNS